jgi:hypothetical protein
MHYNRKKEKMAVFRDEKLVGARGPSKAHPIQN